MNRIGSGIAKSVVKAGSNVVENIGKKAAHHSWGERLAFLKQLFEDPDSFFMSLYFENDGITIRIRKKSPAK